MAHRSVSNPPNPWQTQRVEWLDTPPPAELRVYEEDARSILSMNKSPDVGFAWSINPYRGCFHGRAYCYARPTHQYLDFGAGTDFDRKIVIKRNAPELLEKAFMKPSWKGELVIFSGNTDCYQPLEASYELTRRLLVVCAAFRNPVGIITKGALIRRDIDVLCDLKRDAAVEVHISIPFFDAKMSRRMEPGAPSPRMRLATIAALAEAGIPVSVAVAPIIPGLNDDQIVAILEAAAEAGATSAFRVMVRLADEVEPVFLERLADSFPERYDKVVSSIRDCRDGKMYNSAFGRRGIGSGPRWEVIDQIFEKTCRRLGLHIDRGQRDGQLRDVASCSPFRRPGQQLDLFQ